MKLLKASFLIAAAAFSLNSAQAQQSPSVTTGSFTDLGTFGGNYSYAQAISADGSVVVGQASIANGNNHAFRWTSAGMVDLGSLGGNYSYSRAVSADGSVVVGQASIANGNEQAFRWTSAGMVNLGTFGGNYSSAYGMSADGSVVIGYAYNTSNGYRAFRWTSAGMVDLGTLGGDSSSANAVSTDGLVVVGQANNASNQSRAFRWTSAGMVDLGTFGGNYSSSRAVSADGSVVVGQAEIASGQTRAFRWTSAGMVNLGTFGGNYSYSQAVSADGSVVIGRAEIASGQGRAFRWTSAGMVNLGTFGGNYSSAYGMSADGSVVVGYAEIASGRGRAFRWTSAGMVDLGTFGGDSSYAYAVSADGSTVVGQADNASGQSRAFLHRGRTLLDADAWLASVGGNSRIYNDGTTLAGLPLEGAHHRPMLSFDRMGKSSQAWATGDFGSSSRTRDVHVTTGEAGINWNVGKTGLIGFAAGHGVQNANLAYEGSSATKGDYALVEYDYRPEGTQWIVSLLGMVGSWESEINRGYITGTGTDFSAGVTDTITRSARLRVDAPSLVTYGGFGFAPFASYTVTRTIVGAYTETGGSFAASFNEQDHTAQEGRVGVTATKDLSEKTKLLLRVEAIHRFDGAGPALIGQEIVGGIAFNQPGVAPRKDCVRFGFDVDHKLSADTLLNISAHASTVGEAHDVSAAISIRRAF
jgi:probable HAF family extracellular repeat protein